MQKSLWLWGTALALFGATLVVGNGFVSADKAVTRRSAGHDFLAFYTAGTFVRTGRSGDLYDLDAVRSFQQHIASEQQLELSREALGPYWNPPFFALVFVPLSKLPYPTAWNAWFVINLIALFGAMALMMRWLPGDWRSRGLVPLLVLVAPPLIVALGHGQNTCISLLLLCVTVTCWRGGRATLAGIAAGLLFYKPQLGAIVAAALLLTMGWKPLLGLASTGTALLLVTLVALPHTLGDFLHRLPQNIAYMQVEHRYLWDRHVTLKAFWRLLIQRFTVGEVTTLTRAVYFGSVGAIGALLFLTIWQLRSHRAARDLLIAATIVSMPLLMPFYFDYDLLLLAVAAVLVARHSIDCGTIDRTVVALWIATFLWTAINASVAARTHVNITVVLLTTLAVTLLSRARRSFTLSPGERAGVRASDEKLQFAAIGSTT